MKWAPARRYQISHGQDELAMMSTDDYRNKKCAEHAGRCEVLHNEEH